MTMLSDDVEHFGCWSGGEIDNILRISRRSVCRVTCSVV